jgi:FkbM family methyltransferase
VDVGANDGFTGSLSYPFIARGWQGILFEPHPVAFAQLRRRYRGSRRCAVINAACADYSGQTDLVEGKGGSIGCSTICRDSNQWLDEVRSEVLYRVNVVKLKDVLESLKVPRDFAVLTIDAEHMDYEVLCGLCLTSSFAPRVVVSEDSGFQKDGIKQSLLRTHGYQHIIQIGCNGIWLRT